MRRGLALIGAALLALLTTASSCDGPKCIQWGQQYQPGHYEPGHYVSGSCSGTGTSRRCSAGHSTPGHQVAGHYVSYCLAYEQKKDGNR